MDSGEISAGMSPGALPAPNLERFSAEGGARPPVSHGWGLDEGARLRRLLWVFAGLTALLAAPSVVGRIEYARTAAQERARLAVARENLRDFKLDQLSASYRMLAQVVGPSVVNIRSDMITSRGPTEGQGSGVIVDKDGYIVTNNHVVEGVSSVELQLSDGRRGTATVVGTDPLTDIAVLKTEMSELTAAEWGDSDAAEVGDVVWAVGSPFGLQKSITFGILSAKERRGITQQMSRAFGGVVQEFLQTDAAVNPGNSGGPLVNYEGKVIGINTAIIGPSYQGISFAVPSALAKESYDQLRKNGYVLRGYLGVQPEELPAELAELVELKPGEGVLVTLVKPNTPASEAGLRNGDVIVAWNGQKFADPTLLSRAIAASPIGAKTPVKVVRRTRAGRQELDLEVTVAARPVE